MAHLGIALDLSRGRGARSDGLVKKSSSSLLKCASTRRVLKETFSIGEESLATLTMQQSGGGG